MSRTGIKSKNKQAGGQAEHALDQVAHKHGAPPEGRAAVVGVGPHTALATTAATGLLPPVSSERKPPLCCSGASSRKRSSGTRSAACAPGGQGLGGGGRGVGGAKRRQLGWVASSRVAQEGSRGCGRKEGDQARPTCGAA